MTASEPNKPGLRERKKAKTRALIQNNAIRLFREQGYQETTIEQIAALSEVSPSTMFRYFPTKESLVFEDDFDPVLVEGFRKQPPGISPIRAFLETVEQVNLGATAEQRRELRDRIQLIHSVPELSAAYTSQLSTTIDLFAGLIAERAGKRPDDLGVLAYAGAMVGAVLGANSYCTARPEADYFETIAETLRQLEHAMNGNGHI